MAKKRGKGGAALAHWQVGMAYAKYLNHDFHMWCNEVVSLSLNTPQERICRA